MKKSLRERALKSLGVGQYKERTTQTKDTWYGYKTKDIILIWFASTVIGVSVCMVALFILCLPMIIMSYLI